MICCSSKPNLASKDKMVSQQQQQAPLLPLQQHQQLTASRRAKIVRLLEIKIEKNNLQIIKLTAAMQAYVHN